MKTIVVDCVLSGDNFSPRLLEELTGLSLDDKTEVGEISKYKGIPITFGSASFSYSFTEEERKNGADELNAMLETLEKNYQALKTAGVEEMILYLIFGYVFQCNWEIPPHQIKRLAALNIHFCISCYREDDDYTMCEDDEYIMCQDDYEDESEDS
jgi:hypothetical protein